MNQRFAACTYSAVALLAGCASSAAPPQPVMNFFQATFRYAEMGADRALGAAINSVEQACPLRMADALAAAVKEINTVLEGNGRPPVALDKPDPQSFISLYNRLAKEEPQIGTKRLLRHAVDGMAKALDPEAETSGYMYIGSMTGPFGSVGLELKSEAAQIIVTGAIPDSPASREDIRAGDRLVAVDATEVTGLYLDEVIEKLRGKEGSPVELTISRDSQAGDFKKFTLMRQVVSPVMPKPELQMQGRTAIITLPGFDEATSRELAKALREAREAGAAGYIIDMRKNNGGLLNQIVETASIFLKPGRVLSTAPPAECGSTEPGETYNVKSGFKLTDAPMIVLISKDTGSGAELFAAAMSENGRARLVGQRTAGKGVVHTVAPLGNSAAMRIKTHELLTSQGARITGVGVKPTVEVPESDDALDRALQLLMTR